MCGPGFLVVGFIVINVFVIREKVVEARAYLPPAVVSVILLFILLFSRGHIGSLSLLCLCSHFGGDVNLSAPVVLVVTTDWLKFRELWTCTWSCGSVPPGACHDRDAGTPYLHAEVSGAWIIVPATGPVPTVVWAVAAANDELAIAEA